MDLNAIVVIIISLHCKTLTRLSLTGLEPMTHVRLKMQLCLWIKQWNEMQAIMNHQLKISETIKSNRNHVIRGQALLVATTNIATTANTQNYTNMKDQRISLKSQDRFMDEFCIRINILVSHQSLVNNSMELLTSIVFRFYSNGMLFVIWKQTKHVIRKQKNWEIKKLQNESIKKSTNKSHLQWKESHCCF